MSYYDSTVGWYDGQINNNRQSITNCNNQIRAYEDDIDELRRLKVKVGNVDSAVVTAANNTATKVNNLPALIINPFSILRMNFFTTFLDVIKGDEHKKARKASESAIGKIDAKINELQRNIDNLQDEIRRCNGNINTLSSQRSSYIAKATAPKPESEPAPQPAAKKEETKSASKSSSKSSKSSSKKK